MVWYTIHIEMEMCDDKVAFIWNILKTLLKKMYAEQEIVDNTLSPLQTRK